MLDRVIVICCMAASITGAIAFWVDHSCLGVKVGYFQNAKNGVTGKVFIIDEETLFIKNFTYDGSAPDAYFYAGTGNPPPGDRFLIPDENGSSDVLMEYMGKDLVLRLPKGKSLSTVTWFSVWCRQHNEDLGHVIISNCTCNNSITIPQPRKKKLGSFMNTDHGVKSGDVIVLTENCLLIPEFSFDGLAPDTHFFVGNGSSPNVYGQPIPDENGSNEKLREYNCETIVLHLPKGLTIWDFDWLSVWCVQAKVSFGYILVNVTVTN